MNKEQSNLIEHIKSKLDRFASMVDYVSLFPGWKIIKDNFPGGQYFYDTATIYIDGRDSLILQYDTFFHEFGHLIHEACDHTDFYKHYSRGNLNISQLLNSEIIASAIGLEFWKFKFPNIKSITLHDPFSSEDVKIFKNYYQDFFEDK